MAAAHILRKELRRCIKDYMHQWGRDRTGDATTSELTVMACTTSDEPLSIPEALGWTSRHLRKHPDLIDNMLHTGMDQGKPMCANWYSESDDGLNSDLIESINEPSYRLDKAGHWLDVFKRDYMGFQVPIQESNDFGATLWSSPIGHANVFLRRRLFPYACPSHHTHFRLMDLPTEIRELIFEFALLLPRSGVWYDFQTRYRSDNTSYRYAKAWTASREIGLNEYSPSLWNTEKDSPHVEPRTLFQVDLDSHLALLRVNKTIYKEALPGYYSQNFFYIPSDYACKAFLEEFSGPSGQHIRNIVWHWSVASPPSLRLAQQLTALPRLRMLIIIPSDRRDDLPWGWIGLQALSDNHLSELENPWNTDLVALDAAFASVSNVFLYAEKSLSGS